MPKKDLSNYKKLNAKITDTTSVIHLYESDFFTIAEKPENRDYLFQWPREGTSLGGGNHSEVDLYVLDVNTKQCFCYSGFQNYSEEEQADLRKKYPQLTSEMVKGLFGESPFERASTKQKEIIEAMMDFFGDDEEKAPSSDVALTFYWKPHTALIQYVIEVVEELNGLELEVIKILQEFSVSQEGQDYFRTLRQMKVDRAKEIMDETLVELENDKEFHTLPPQVESRKRFIYNKWQKSGKLFLTQKDAGITESNYRHRHKK